jgi:hypothetical protein
MFLPNHQPVNVDVHLIGKHLLYRYLLTNPNQAVGNFITPHAPDSNTSKSCASEPYKSDGKTELGTGTVALAANVVKYITINLYLGWLLLIEIGNVRKGPMSPLLGNKQKCQPGNTGLSTLWFTYVLLVKTNPLENCSDPQVTGPFWV